MNHRIEIPSVEQVLARTSVGNGFHRWPTYIEDKPNHVVVSYVEAPAEVLRKVLEVADDPSDYNWDEKVDFSDGAWYVSGEPVCDIYGFAPATEVKA
jgi:hypothetical protein